MKSTTPVKKVAKKTEEPLKEGYNRFGVCLACNGNNLECTHNNLREENGSIICNTCQEVIK